MNEAAPRPLIAWPADAPLRGTARLPGDKSLSHRALLLGALAEGETRVTGLLEGEDVLSTAGAVRALGAPVARVAPGEWTVAGGGLGALAEPEEPVDCGNAGTLARLLSGVIAANPITATLTGDASLRSRPMERVFAPLRGIGAAILGRSGDRLPATIRGARRVLPLEWTLPVASAQVKSALLLAGLHGPGETSVVEPVGTRDHTERMLARMGADLDTEPLPNGGFVHRIRGDRDLSPLSLEIPRDPSSAALVSLAALLVPGSDIDAPGVCVNPTRSGYFETLAEMGAAVELRNRREEGGEPVADLRIRAGPLKAVRTPPERAPSMIDEFPALAALAAFAEGTTVMEGIRELRAKESDRIDAMARGLAACGVRVEAGADSLAVHGAGRPRGGATVASFGDHRIAMAFLALGLGAAEPVRIDDSRSIDTSFPEFRALLTGLGADLREDAT